MGMGEGWEREDGVREGVWLGGRERWVGWDERSRGEREMGGEKRGRGERPVVLEFITL